MTALAIQIINDNSTGFSVENLKGIENHKNAALYFEAAAKNHRDAAKYHEEGNHDAAFKSTLFAQGNQRIATEYQKEDFIHHDVLHSH